MHYTLDGHASVLLRPVGLVAKHLENLYTNDDVVLARVVSLFTPSSPVLAEHYDPLIVKVPRIFKKNEGNKGKEISSFFLLPSRSSE